jgi:4-carboxymuconolactone decarboxylase
MRLAVLSSDEMSAEQVDLYREILAGPFNAMLYAPAVGHALQELGAAIRFRTKLTPRIREMAILVVAQAAGSDYEQASHEPIGRDAGLTESELDALRADNDPKFADEQESVAYSTARALTVARDLDDEEYAEAINALGEEGLVELSTLVGYYATLALQLRIFRVPAPA